MPVSNQTSQKFKTTVNKNMEKLDEALKKIGEVAISEDFTEQDKQVIFKYIQKQVAAAKKLFEISNDDPHGFQL